MFGKCKACAVHEALAASLREEVKFLRTLAHPPVNNAFIPDSDHEANGVLGADTRQLAIVTYADSQLALSEAEQIERDSILGATY